MTLEYGTNFASFKGASLTLTYLLKSPLHWLSFEDNLQPRPSVFFLLHVSTIARQNFNLLLTFQPITVCNPTGEMFCVWLKYPLHIHSCMMHDRKTYNRRKADVPALMSSDLASEFVKTSDQNCLWLCFK